MKLRTHWWELSCTFLVLALSSSWRVFRNIITGDQLSGILWSDIFAHHNARKRRPWALDTVKHTKLVDYAVHSHTGFPTMVYITASEGHVWISDKSLTSRYSLMGLWQSSTICSSNNLASDSKARGCLALLSESSTASAVQSPKTSSTTGQFPQWLFIKNSTSLSSTIFVLIWLSHLFDTLSISKIVEGRRKVKRQREGKRKERYSFYQV